MSGYTDNQVNQALKSIRKKVQSERFKSNGICYLLSLELYPYEVGKRGKWPEADLVVKELAQKWPKYSGNPLYPVPPTYLSDARSQFLDADNKWEGEYGRLRHELLDFLISETDNK